MKNPAQLATTVAITSTNVLTRNGATCSLPRSINFLLFPRGHFLQVVYAARWQDGPAFPTNGPALILAAHNGAVAPVAGLGRYLSPHVAARPRVTHTCLRGGNPGFGSARSSSGTPRSGQPP